MRLRLSQSTVVRYALATVFSAVVLTPSAVAQSPENGVWVLSTTEVNPDNVPVPANLTGFAVEPGHIAWTYLDPTAEEFSSSFDATYALPPERVEAGASVPIDVTVGGEITRDQDQRYTGMALTLVQNRYWDETIGVEQNCVGGAPDGGFTCSEPESASGALEFNTPTSAASGDTFDFAVTALNCSACTVRFTYTFEAGNVDEVPAALIVRLQGDVELQRLGASASIPLTIETVLQEGDTIVTGYESEVVVWFGDTNQLVVPQLTSLRIDELVVDPGKRVTTQLYLNIGRVRARIQHTPSTRSDFSVVTPTAHASIRGSEMQVTYDENSGATIVEVLEDEAVVRAAGGGEETTLAEGEIATVDIDGLVEVSTAQNEDPVGIGEGETIDSIAVTEESSEREGSNESLPYVPIGMALAAVIGVAVLVMRVRT